MRPRIPNEDVCGITLNGIGFFLTCYESQLGADLTRPFLHTKVFVTLPHVQIGPDWKSGSDGSASTAINLEQSNQADKTLDVREHLTCRSLALRQSQRRNAVLVERNCPHNTLLEDLGLHQPAVNAR